MEFALFRNSWAKNEMHFYMEKAVSVLADRNRKQVILAFTLGHTILHS